MGAVAPRTVICIFDVLSAGIWSWDDDGGDVTGSDCPFGGSLMMVRLCPFCSVCVGLGSKLDQLNLNACNLMLVKLFAHLRRFERIK